jgi:hypothetical protein
MLAFSSCDAMLSLPEIIKQLGAWSTTSGPKSFLAAVPWLVQHQAGNVLAFEVVGGDINQAVFPFHEEMMMIGAPPPITTPPTSTATELRRWQEPASVIR